MSAVRLLIPNLKCFGMDCAERESCWRYRSPSNPYSQGYLVPSYDDKGQCLDRWNLTHSQVQELNERKKK